VNALRARLRVDDEGFSLVELVIATAILSIILLAVGGLMFSTTITQRSVSAVTGASSSAQTAADGIRTQLRNAAEFRLTTVDAHDQLLVARVAGAGTATAYVCRAWYFAVDERELRTRTWAVAGSTALPTGPSGVATWELLLSEVTPRSGSTVVFDPPVGGTIGVAFEVATDDRNDPIAIEFTAAQSGNQGGGTTCWD
jgi:prepilin-type N-terminal cleavage/methylation domain-containing protein